MQLTWLREMRRPAGASFRALLSCIESGRGSSLEGQAANSRLREQRRMADAVEQNIL